MKKLTKNSKKWQLSKRVHATVAAWAWLGRVVVVAIALVLTGCQSPTPARSDQAELAGDASAPSYKADIAPLLKQKCSTCHGFLIAEKGLRLNSLANLFKGGESGPAVVPGAPQNSPLYTALLLPSTDVRHMPPLAAGPGLDDGQKALIRDWIVAGAN